MRAPAALATLLLLAGCGRPDSAGDGGVTQDQIARLAVPKVEIVDTQAAARPRPLKIADLVLSGIEAPDCAFGRNGRMLFAASADDAIARVGGRLVHFTHSAPMGSSGGFFEDRQLSISVGRTSETDADIGRWPARITITNRRAEAQIELDGVWRCGP